MDNTDKDIDRVARGYRRGLFDTDAGWRRLGIAPVSMWRRWRAAAIIAVAVALTATAAILYSTYQPANENVAPIEAMAPVLTDKVEAIDFENAPLPAVIAAIEATYGVEVANVPANADSLTLSLHYVGTAADIVAAINETLGTELTVSQI